MAVQVFIRRRLAGGHDKRVAPLIVRLRSLALSQPGYICGETLRCIEPEGDEEYLVRTTWNSVAEWKQWLNSETRRKIQDEIDAITGETTEYRIYEPLVGGIIGR
jgi:heme-degrading monooxygenase HmoA